MKKLMITLAAVAIASVSQAASIDWEIANKAYPFAPTDTVNPAKSTPRTANYTVMLFAASDLTAVQTILASGTTEGLSDIAWIDANKTKATGKANGANIDVGANSSWSAFAVVFDTYTSEMTMADAKNYIISETVTQSTYSGTDPAKSLVFGSEQFAGKSWQAIAVPEPTSGLLLLFGVAGMALRRRRA